MAYSDKDRRPNWAKSRNKFRVREYVDTTPDPKTVQKFGTNVPQGHFFVVPETNGEYRIHRKTILGEGIKPEIPSNVTLPYERHHEAFAHATMLNEQMIQHGEVKKWN